MSNVFSGTWLVQGGTVTDVANTINDTDNFAIRVTGGTTNLCSNWITFPKAEAADPETHERAYATALTALTTGVKVNIYNYDDSSCDKAVAIAVVK